MKYKITVDDEYAFTGEELRVKHEKKSIEDGCYYDVTIVYDAKLATVFEILGHRSFRRERVE